MSVENLIQAGFALGGMVVGAAASLAAVGKQVDRHVSRRWDPNLTTIITEMRDDIKSVAKTTQELAVRQASIIATMKQDSKDRIERQRLIDQLCQDCRDRLARLESTRVGHS